MLRYASQKCRREKSSGARGLWSSSAARRSGIAIGGGLAFFLGGQIGAAYGWRWDFYLLGFPGLLLCFFVLSLREARRGQAEVGSGPSYGAEDWKVLFSGNVWVLILANFVLLAALLLWLGSRKLEREV